MKTLGILVSVLVSLAGVLPAQADPCVVNLITHGTIRDLSGSQGACWQLVDDGGVPYEILNPKGSWRDGMTGTLYGAMQGQGICGAGTPVQVCNFDADYSRNVVGTLALIQFVECPGYVIEAQNQQYLIRNCQDFGTDLCAIGNIGRRIKAEVFVDTGVSICLGMARSIVVDYDFLK